MTNTNSDRRRFFMATALTLLALPALWWASQPENGAPNVATAGIEIGDASAEVEPDAVRAAPETAAPTDEVPPVYLDGPAGQVGAGLSEVAVPASTGERHTTTATFRSTLGSSNLCIVGGMSNGLQVTVVNLENGRSVNCTTQLAPSGTDPRLVMSASLFREIADPTDAPVPVEIRR